jgi:hypothetical protein
MRRPWDGWVRIGPRSDPGYFGTTRFLEPSVQRELTKQTTRHDTIRYDSSKIVKTLQPNGFYSTSRSGTTWVSQVAAVGCGVTAHWNRSTRRSRALVYATPPNPQNREGPTRFSFVMWLLGDPVNKKPAGRRPPPRQKSRVFFLLSSVSTPSSSGCGCLHPYE